MPAIRLASHYLRRKPFSLSFFFFWMRGCEPLDSHSACMGRKITIRFSNTKTCSLDRFRLRWPSHAAFNTKTLGETCCFILASAKLCPRQPFGRFMEGFRSVYTKIGLIIVRRINSHTVLFFDRQTDADRSGPFQKAQKWSEVMWIVALRMARGTKSC